MEKYKVSKQSDGSFVTMADGIMRKTHVFGDSTILCEFKLSEGRKLPNHTHPHEQTGYLVSGRLLFTIAGNNHEMNAGDTWCINSGIEHSVEVIKDSVVIEVFSPVREDFI